MNAVAITTLATTLGECTKLATSVMQYKATTYAIDAELAKAELDFEYKTKQIKADAKRTKQKISACSNANRDLLRSFNKDKKEIKKQWADCMKQAVNFSLTAEQRQEAREMAQILQNYMDNIRHDQLTSQRNYHNSLERFGGSSGRTGVVIDGECS